MSLKLFEEGLKLFSRKDFAKAIEKFTKAMESSDNLQFIAKCKTYIAICKDNLEKNSSNEIDYGYAVFLINNGKYKESKKVLDEIFKKGKDETYHYLYAIAEAGENNELNAEKYLKKAIAKNPSLIHLATKEPVLKSIISKISR